MISFELLVIGAGILAMLFAIWKTTWILKQDQGNEKMEKIGANIAEGAMSFLRAEYRVLIIFVITIAAAELALAIAIILRLYRNKSSINTDDINIMKW